MNVDYGLLMTFWWCHNILNMSLLKFVLGQLQARTLLNVEYVYEAAGNIWNAVQSFVSFPKIFDRYCK